MQYNDYDFDPCADCSGIIGLMACALSGAIVGCIAGALGATLYIAWWLG